MNLSILYRGPLSSCNYGCNYCPFAKHAESAAELAHDRAALERFAAWIEEHAEHEISVLFTPWGEALIRRWYQNALVRLSNLAHIRRVAIQTNLSGSLDWLADCDKTRLALWTTFHPTETGRERFLARCHLLQHRGVRFSVGVVGLKDHAEEIAALRRELPAGVYLWINAYKDQADYYSAADLDCFTDIDPLFPINNQRHASLGRACRAGHTVIAVDGAGVMRRCHFIKQPIGNLYDPHFEQALQPSPCTNETCGCYIGYVHLEPLNLDRIYGSGLLERIPLTSSQLSAVSFQPEGADDRVRIAAVS